MGIAKLKDNFIPLRKIERPDEFNRVNKEIVHYVGAQLGDEIPEAFYWNCLSKPGAIDSHLNGAPGFADLRVANRFRRINKHFERANRALETGQYYIVSFENSQTRKHYHYRRYSKFLGSVTYMTDTVINRVLPKLSATKRFYFSFRKNPDRILSNTECLGRLVSCGFKIISYKKIGGQSIVITKKVSDPAYDPEPTYGVFCRLNRVGKDKKMINVPKIRTMHPYSEYLQEYIYDLNGTKDGDKITNDFRITPWGRVFRKLWIDELPMLWNLLKGEIKLVGVRPLSKHKFDTYPEWLQEQRTQVKPGLVPPFYADLPENVEEFYYTEGKYLTEYVKKPIRTDIKYFVKAMYNIFIKRARSA